MVSISIKDNICITGTKTTCASKMLENFIAPYTSTVVNHLQNEDAVITGKQIWMNLPWVLQPNLVHMVLQRIQS